MWTYFKYIARWSRRRSLAFTIWEFIYVEWEFRKQVNRKNTYVTSRWNRYRDGQVRRKTWQSLSFFKRISRLCDFIRLYHRGSHYLSLSSRVLSSLEARISLEPPLYRPLVLSLGNLLQSESSKEALSLTERWPYRYELRNHSDDMFIGSAFERGSQSKCDSSAWSRMSWNGICKRNAS